MKRKDIDKLNTHAMLDGADIYSRDFFVGKGKEGGKKGGGKWFKSLTPEEQQAHINKMVKGKKTKLSTSSEE